MDEQRALTGDLVYRLETPGSPIKQGIPGSTGGHGDGGYADLGLNSYEWKDNLVLIDPDFVC